MSAIKAKNILKLGESKRRRLWDELRDEPYLNARIRVSDIISVPLIGRWSVGARGALEALIGDDPGKL